MIPSRLVVLGDLPRLPNGKIHRQQLRDMVLEPEGRDREETQVLNTREQALISLWEGLLGRTGIGLTDNFFELGGHSLLVVEMTLAIERDFEVTLSAADVFENPTVRDLARRINQRGGSSVPPYQHLFPIQPLGRAAPFIVAVPHFFTDMFAERFRGERPVYGLRGVSLRPEGNRGRWRTLTDLGEELVEEICRRFPDEGVIIAGYSFGASMAIEAVRIMEERGIPVHRLYLIAPMPVDIYRFGAFGLQIDGLRQPVKGLTRTEALRRYLRSNHPLTRRPYQRARRWLVVEPWRRLLCGVGRLRKLAGLPLTPRILHADLRVERFRLHARYRPGRIQAPTVIFNAEDTETDAAATWRPYFKGPFTVHETPDPHDEASVEAARKLILRHLHDLGDS
jgi:acyl carrier protein